MARATCSACNADLPAKARFCPSCGALSAYTVARTMRASFAGAVALAALAGCRSPTQIDVSVSTNVPCPSVSGTAVTTGTLGEIETIPPTSTTQACVNEHIGSVVLVPTGDDDALVGFKVVTAINGETLDNCAPGDGGSYGANCIVARRAIRYLPHTPLQVDVLMSSACAGIACDAQSTCVEGACVPATIGNPAQCEANGCTEGVLGVADAGAADATLPDAGPTDAGPTDATIEGQAPDAAHGADAATLPCDTRGLLADAAWPMEGYCPSGRYRSPLVGPTNAAWKWSVPVPGGAASAPSIGSDGTLYLGSVDGVVQALRPLDGGVLWSTAPFEDAGVVESMPVLAADGTIRVFNFGMAGGYGVLALDGSTLLVAPEAQVRGGVAIAGNGTTYVTDTFNAFDALNPEGGVIFTLPLLGQDHAYPSIASNGTIFSTDDNGNVFAILPDGGELWADFIDGSPGGTNPIEIAPDGTLRTYSYDDVLYALDPGGRVLWQTQVGDTGGGDLRGLAIADDGTTYVGTPDGLFAYEPVSGKLRPNPYTDYSVSDPVIDAEGNVYGYLGKDMGALASFDSACNLRWQVAIPSGTVPLPYVEDTPVLGPGGMVYIVVSDNESNATLHAFVPVP